MVSLVLSLVAWAGCARGAHAGCCGHRGNNKLAKAVMEAHAESETKELGALSPVLTDKLLRITGPARLARCSAVYASLQPRTQTRKPL